jgi:hypothetical protein
LTDIVRAIIEKIGTCADSRFCVEQVFRAMRSPQNPLPKLHRLHENMGSLSIELSSDDLRDINDAAYTSLFRALGILRSWSK